jgi:hypothetical protein
MAVLMGFCSFGIDYGTVVVAKTQLRAACDAACRAAVVGFGTSVSKSRSDAIAIAAANTCYDHSVTLATNDVEFGTWDDVHQSFTPLSGAAQATASAIRVRAYRTAARGNPIPLLFAKLIGKSTCDVTAVSIAKSSTSGFSIVGLNSLSILKGVGGSSGNPPKMDSWNSAAGPYVSYPMNSHGNCASNGTVTLSTNVSVKGDCRPGKGKSFSGSGYTITGATAPLTYTLQYPAPKPGNYATTNDNAKLLALPGGAFTASTRSLSMSNKYTYTIPGGVYYINNLSWSNSHITFTGPAIFYVTGTTFSSVNSYITTYQNLPANLKFEICGAATVTYDFDQACYAVLYAPLATVTTTGLADDYGSVVGYNLTMGVGWHVDEALSGAGVSGLISYVK